MRKHVTALERQDAPREVVAYLEAPSGKLPSMCWIFQRLLAIQAFSSAYHRLFIYTMWHTSHTDIFLLALLVRHEAVVAIFLDR
jgi:hypothetical protein